jgi:hypothetical protein
VFVQFHNSAPEGQSNVHFYVLDNKKVALRVLGGNMARPAKRYVTLAPLVRGRWYDFVFHVRWSSSRSGFVEVWVNGVLVLRRIATPTLYTGQSVYLKQGYYRSAFDATTVVYQDDIRRARTLADVLGPPTVPR